MRSSLESTLWGTLAWSPWLRRFAWRAGRALYRLARGEQRFDDMRLDGELVLQARTFVGNSDTRPFIAFDIGANHGDWTAALVELAMSQEGSARRLKVRAFEPVPTTGERLAARMSGLAPDADIRIESVAASDKAGSLEMIVMSETGGTNSLVFDKAMKRDALGFITVPLVTLDQYCLANEIPHIHIVKCDTEGNDLFVLRGAVGLLKSGRIDVFQFEYNHRWITARAFLKDVFELVDVLPYRVGRVMPNSIEIFESWHPELEHFFQSNYVVVKESAIGWFRINRGKFDVSNTYA